MEMAGPDPELLGASLKNEKVKTAVGLQKSQADDQGKSDPRELFGSFYQVPHGFYLVGFYPKHVSSH